MLGAVWFAVAVGVGKNPNSVADMGGTNGTSRKALPLRVIPARGQVPENVSQPSRTQDWDVLHDREARSNLANKSGEFAPETGLLASEASAVVVGQRDVLAGESPADDIGSNSICLEPLGGKFSDIVIDRNLGPMLLKDAAGKLLDLAEGDRLKPARALQPQREAADAREEVQHPQLRAQRPTLLGRILWARGYR
jgi:hypothetical protein